MIPGQKKRLNNFRSKCPPRGEYRVIVLTGLDFITGEAVVEYVHWPRKRSRVNVKRITSIRYA